MSEISRSSRLTSCWITASSRCWLSGDLGERQRLDRRAQRVSGFLSSWATSAAKALDRLDAAVERAGHVAQRAGKVPDLVAPAGQIGDFDARADAVTHAFGAFGEPLHRPGDGAGEQDRQHHHHAEQDQEQLDDLQPLGLDRLVDVAALRRQQQRAAHLAEALHRHRHRDDDLAEIVDAHHRGALGAGERLRDFGVVLAGVGPELAIERQVAAAEPAAERVHHAPHGAGLGLVRRRQVEPHHLAWDVEVAAVDDEIAVAVVDARARAGRRDQAAQHRRHALGVDREFQAGDALVDRSVVLARLQLEQPVAVHGAAVAVGGGGGRNRAGDDLALHHEALHPRVDQAGAELRQIENADDEREQARDVERDDAAREAREALADKELPGALHDTAQAAVLVSGGDPARQTRKRVTAGTRRRLVGTFRLGALWRCFGGSIEQWGCCRPSSAPRVPS